MTTIKDVARISGVSHGTVSNVLNKRGNVSIEKIEQVERVAKEMGFQLNTQAQLLRKGSHKLICVILPSLNRKRYLELYDVIVSEARKAQYDVSLYITNNQVDEEKKVLDLCYAQHATCVVCISSIIDGTDVFLSTVRHIFVDRKPKGIPRGSSFVGFDFPHAAMTIFNDIKNNGGKSITFVSGEYSFSDKNEFSTTLETASLQNGVTYDIVEGNEAMLYRNLFFHSIEDNTQRTIVCADREVKEIVERVFKMTEQKNISLYTLTYADLFYDANTSYFELDYRHMAKQIFEQVLKNIFIDEILQGKLLVETRSHVSEEKGLRILLLDSATTAAIKSLTPLVKKEKGIDVQIDVLSYNDMYDFLKLNKKHDYDVIRLDLAWVKAFANQEYQGLDEDKQYQKIKESIRERVPNVYFETEEQKCMIPLDTCTQVLYYRKDLFEDASLQRKYYEQTKKELKVPVTMQEFDEISKFFSQKYNKNSPVAFGCTVVCGGNDVLSADLMPRLFEEDITFEKKEGNFDFSNQKLNRIIDQYIKNIQYGHSSTTTLWSEAATEFRQGTVAMMIIFSIQGVNLMNTTDAALKGKIGVSQVPGKHPLLGGGVLGICKGTKKKAVALDFLEWLYSEQVISKLIFLGALVPSRHMNSYHKIIENYPWLESFDESYQVGTRSYGAFDLTELEEQLGAYVRSKIVK